jgi:hypothetical protein
MVGAPVGLRGLLLPPLGGLLFGGDLADLLAVEDEDVALDGAVFEEVCAGCVFHGAYPLVLSPLIAICLDRVNVFLVDLPKNADILVFMDEKHAEWRDYLKDEERREWEAGREARDRFRELNRKLKSRCLARMMREARRGKD